jgi:hypothetical protein
MADAYFAGQVGLSTKPMEFESRDALVNFCRDWINQWQWARHGNRSSVVQIYANFLSQLEQGISHLSNARTQQQGLQILTSCFSSWSTSGPQNVLGPQDPKALFVLKIRDKYGPHGPDAAHGCLTVFLGGNIAFGSPLPMGFFLGMWEGFLFKEGYTDPTPYNGQILTSFMNDREKAFAELGEKFQATISQADVTVRESGAVVHAAKEAAEKQADTFNQILASSKAEMEGIKRSLEEEMSLRAPVKYWEDKAIAHKNSARRLGWAVALASVIVLDSVLGIVGILARLSGTQKPELWELGIAALIAGLLIYLLRIIVRIQLSHLHLSTDAEQRAVMVQTYLSLEYHKEIMTKEDRHLILEALFRPVGAGLVKDDLSSLSLLEFIMSKKPGP